MARQRNESEVATGTTESTGVVEVAPAVAETFVAPKMQKQPKIEVTIVTDGKLSTKEIEFEAPRFPSNFAVTPGNSGAVIAFCGLTPAEQVQAQAEFWERRAYQASKTAALSIPGCVTPELKRVITLLVQQLEKYRGSKANEAFAAWAEGFSRGAKSALAIFADAERAVAAKSDEVDF